MHPETIKSACEISRYKFAKKVSGSKNNPRYEKRELVSTVYENSQVHEGKARYFLQTKCVNQDGLEQIVASKKLHSIEECRNEAVTFATDFITRAKEA